jgi:photosystem I subunit 8
LVSKPLNQQFPYKIMTAAYLPSILVPLIGLIFPGLTMAFAFIYIEQEEIA